MESLKETQAYVDKQRQSVNDKLDSLHLFLSNDDKQELEGKKHHILVIDDALADVDIMRRYLNDSKIKFDMMVIDNGQDAIAYLERESQFENMPIPDLIIIDLNLPHISGSQVLKYLRKNKHLAWIPRMVVAEDKHKIESLLASQNGQVKTKIVHKPLVKNEVLAALASLNPFFFHGLAG